MSRVQLSLNVADLDAAVAFYSRLFGAEPAKLRPGYANFAIADPPLKLVLNTPGNGPSGTINHLGVEVESHRGGRQRRGADGRTGPGRHARARHGVLLRPARQGVGARPRGLPWEYYTVLEHVETP